VRAHRGSISAEHGVGLLKKPYLSYSRAPEELAMLRAVKRALDPKNTLNPGKIIDL
jgi:FAD/FMN-containing dehydrogenase